MFSKLNPRGALALGLALVAALSMVVAGCGGDKKSKSKDVSVRTGTQSKRTTTVTLPPPAPVARALKTPPKDTVVTTPEPPRVVTFDEAEAAYHERRYDDAVELFARYCDRKSENPWGHYMLGLSAWKAGEHERAETALERSLELDASHVKSWVNLSRVLLDTSRPTKALTKIDEALALDSESGTAFRLRGRAFHQLGRSEEAVAAYRQAIQIDNNDAWSMNNLALILIEEGRFDEALSPLARAVELRDDVATFHNNLGMALEWSGHFRAAEDAYRSAVDIDGSYEKASANLERVAVVHQEPDLGPVDLAAASQSFVEEIESWGLAVAESVPAQMTVPDAQPIATDSDSTEAVTEP